MNTSSRWGPFGWLYLTLPLLGGLFWLESRAALSPLEHRLAQVVILLIVFGLAWAWCGANTELLMVGHAPEDEPVRRQLVLSRSDESRAPFQVDHGQEAPPASSAIPVAGESTEGAALLEPGSLSGQQAAAMPGSPRWQEWRN